MVFGCYSGSIVSTWCITCPVWGYFLVCIYIVGVAMVI